MGCEIPGCNCKASKVLSGGGIYRGVCIDWTFHCCPFHSRKEIDKAIEKKAENLAAGSQMVNPFMAVIAK